MVVPVESRPPHAPPKEGELLNVFVTIEGGPPTLPEQFFGQRWENSKLLIQSTDKELNFAAF